MNRILVAAAALLLAGSPVLAQQPTMDDAKDVITIISGQRDAVLQQLTASQLQVARLSRELTSVKEALAKKDVTPKEDTKPKPEDKGDEAQH